MGLRAYLLINVKDEIDQEDFVNALREVEEIPGVEFVDPVIGSHDMVVTLHAPNTVEAVTDKIHDHHWFRDMKVLKLINLFELLGKGKRRLSSLPL